MERKMLFQSKKLDMTVGVLAHEKGLNEIKKTIDSLKNLQYSYEKIVAVLPTSEICTIPFDNTKLIKKGDCLTTAIDSICEVAQTEWVYFIFAGIIVPKNIDNKNSKYIKSYKDILFPVVNRNWNFAEATLNGLLLSKKVYEEVGAFGTSNHLELTKLMWADKALQKGCNFKAIVGAKLT